MLHNDGHLIGATMISPSLITNENVNVINKIDEAFMESYICGVDESCHHLEECSVSIEKLFAFCYRERNLVLSF